MSNVLAINKTLSSITVSAWTVYYINSSNAELVTVYDSSNNPYDCFKYLLNNIEYYYVLDGIQNIWTNNLASIGYSLTPSVVFPTVTLPNYGWYNRGSSDAGVYVDSGASFILNDTSGNPLPYDTSVMYGVYMYYSARIGNGTLWAGFSASNDSNQIKLTNTSDTGVMVQRVLFAVCSSNQATVVTVYDSSNNAYNAFKYTVSGTDYWYVLDGTQTDWTDDLASIGYHLPVVLPTVTLDAGWVSIYPNHADFPPNELREGRIWGSGGWVVSTYDSTKTYAAFWWHTDTSGGNLQGYYGVVISDYNGRLGITNVLSYTMTSFVEAHYATCDSPGATAIPVYNSSNVAYTAFKYTIGGVDYYYVLDGTQTDWTDALSSIGYSLTFITQRAYLTTPPHTDKYMDTGRDYNVCDNSGNHITYDSSKTYNVVGGFRVDGTSVSSSFTLLGSFGILNLKNNGSRIEVGYVEYYTI